ncbi:MAG: LysR substrate-binding domain-containing protein [Bacteroidales bacterium]
MNIFQLRYIVALDRYRNFVKAAESCGVTQPTLSSMIQKLEEELDVIIFDRSFHPVKPTRIGEKVIDQASVILFNVDQMNELIAEEKERGKGEIKLAVITTVAPYLLPNLFKFCKKNYPDISLLTQEMTTVQIIEKLKKAEIDMAIAATPLIEPSLLEVPLYYEKFLVYISPEDPLYKEEKIVASKMPLDNLWVLKEGHCLRNQIFNFCHKQASTSAIYEAGSIDTLIKIVDANGGYTVIPELHVNFLSEKQKENIRSFTDPIPLREISLIIRKDFVREKMLNIIADAVKQVIPSHMLDSKLKKFAIRL